MPHMTLAEARGMLGWSQRRLAREAGLNPHDVYDLESGRNLNPSYRMVMLLFRALQRGGLKGITVIDIFPVPDPPASLPRRRAAKAAAAGKRLRPRVNHKTPKAEAA